MHYTILITKKQHDGFGSLSCAEAAALKQKMAIWPKRKLEKTVMLIIGKLTAWPDRACGRESDNRAMLIGKMGTEAI